MYLLLGLLLLNLFQSKGQSLFYVSNGTEVTVKSGTIFTVQGLVLTPSADLTLSGVELTSAASPAQPLTYDHSSFFYVSTPAVSSYGGSIRINYTEADLNGIDESLLYLNVYNGTVWRSYTPTTRDASANYIEVTGLSGLSLQEITIGKFIEPVLSVSGTLSSFAHCAGSASEAQSVSVSGTYLFDPMGIKAPTGFELSTNGSDYTDSLTLSPTSGSVASTLIYIRMKASAEGNPSGSIRFTSTSATTKTSSVDGTSTALITPSVTISSSAGVICPGTEVTFTATPTNGGTPSYQWKLNDNDVGTNSNTYTNSSLVNGDVVKVVMTSSLTCVSSATAVSNTQTMIVITNAGSNALWLGSTNTEWSTGSNWCGGSVPSSGASVTILAGLTNYPVLSADVSVADLDLASGTTLSLNGRELTVTGTVSGTGRFIGSNSASLVIGGSGSLGTVYFSTTTPGSSDALANLTINRSGQTLALGNTLNIYGVITPTAGVLATGGYFGGFLVLKSDSNATARIAPGRGNYITGNVTVERYIPNKGRRYRLLAPMVTSSNYYTINQCWMEGATNSTYVNNNPKPGYGTHITGVSDNVNGFDYTLSGQASLFNIANGTIPTYAPVLSTYTYLNSLSGYFLFIRGSRDVALNLQNTNVAPNPIPLSSSATTLRATGVLNTDTVVFSGVGFSSTPGAKNVVTNPYVSPINWASVYAASEGISDYYTLWDPTIGFRGGFVTVGINGVASAGAATNIIQPGQAFFVQATGGVNAKVVIAESHKTTGNSNTVFAPVSLPAASLQASLYYKEGTGYRRLADGTLSQMDNGFVTAVDAGDALKIENWDEGLAIDQAGNKLAIEQRKIPTVADTLNLSISKMKVMNYELELRVSGFTEKGLQPYLVDRFTGARTLLKNNVSTVVPFSVTINTASSASNRFYVVFMSAATLPLRILNFKAAQQEQGVAVQWQVDEEENTVDYAVERSINSKSFQTILTQQASGMNRTSVSYAGYDAAPMVGNNYYRLKVTERSGAVHYSRVEVVKIGQLKPVVNIFPNPMKGTELTLQLKQWKAGSYRITINDATGQEVYRRNLALPEGNSTQPIYLKHTAAGVYWLRISGAGVEEVRRVVRE